MIKPNSCFNCQRELEEGHHFCPNCGQKVDHNNLTLRAVFTEFYENYLSLDTRLGRTIIPFFVKPGQLTNEFIQGKRVSYANPFRFYIFISIIFFFVLSQVIQKNDNVEGKELVQFSEDSSESVQDQLNNISENLEPLQVAFDSLLEASDTTLVQEKIDSILKSKGLADQIEFKVTEGNEAQDKKTGTRVSFGKNNSNFNLTADDFQKIAKYRYDKDYSDEQLLDSVQLETETGFKRRLFLQIIKLYRADARVFIKFIIGNFSFVMFILIPILGLILFLFFYRTHLPYVGHLIHSLHLHSFVLFLYTLGMIVYYYVPSYTILLVVFLITAFYLYKSFKRVYAYSRGGTVIRWLSVGVVYYIFWIISLLGGLFLSFLLF